MRIVVFLPLIAMLLDACSSPPCRPGEIKVGVSCHKLAVRGEDGGDDPTAELGSCPGSMADDAGFCLDIPREAGASIEVDATTEDAGDAALVENLPVEAAVDAALACKPTTEICDGKDNDCDTQVDEELVNACGGSLCGADLSTKGSACTVGQGDCEGAGIWECDAAKSNDALRCSAVEKPKNECGVSCGALAHPIGQDCSNGALGACTASGKYACAGGVAMCDAAPAMPNAELCDGIDNDCDGKVDNGLANACGGSQCGADLSQLGATCTVGAGNCQGSAIWQCDQAASNNALRCPAVEKAKNACGGGCAVLTNAPGTDCVAGVGACQRRGKWVCVAGGDSVACDAVPGPPGKCGIGTKNGLDEDCDGSVDEIDYVTHGQVDMFCYG